jgi:hypothetical protein
VLFVLTYSVVYCFKVMTQTTSKHILKYWLWIFLICILFLPLLIKEIHHPPSREAGIEFAIQSRLHTIFTAIQVYFNDNGKYPSVENWQDLLLPYLDNKKDAIKLPKKVNTKNTIAINPKADPNSSGDVVLLFESIGEWNANGQLELLAPTSNGKQGCFIVFNDGHIKFIVPEQTKDLNWGNKP